ncbi:MAG: hypothetical protein WDO18_17535 [Acidobacteriota bacterium]
MFNWDDFLGTKDLMKKALADNVGKLKTWLQTQQGNFGTVHQTNAGISRFERNR